MARGQTHPLRQFQRGVWISLCGVSPRYPNNVSFVILKTRHFCRKILWRAEDCHGCMGVCGGMHGIYGGSTVVLALGASQICPSQCRGGCRGGCFGPLPQSLGGVQLLFREVRPPPPRGGWFYGQVGGVGHFRPPSQRTHPTVEGGRDRK